MIPLLQKDGYTVIAVHRDGLFPAIDSLVLAREIPQSRLGIYPDSGHGFLNQYVERFSEDVLRFLGRD